MTGAINQIGYVLQVAPTYWESLAAVVAMFGVASLFLQQTLYLVFEVDLFKRLNESSESKPGARVYRTGFDLKPLISVACSLVIIFRFEFDAYAAILQGGASGFTMVLTAIAFSGGATFLHHMMKLIRQVKEAQAAMRISQAKGVE